jgi:PPK2 family polyphosphate:nucleotide phosphotransferase
MMNLNKISSNPPKGTVKEVTVKKTEANKKKLFLLQNVLFAERKHSVLIVLQGLDAAGKDGTIRHVFSAMNPMGVNIMAFKVPTAEEDSHDFLWRTHHHTPALGMIEVFNRSHYEAILVPSAHGTESKHTMNARCEAINGFEKMLKAEGTVILKFFLHTSKKEQAKRIKERLNIPEKNWKFDPADSREKPFRDAYLAIYEKLFERCGKEIPWIVVPADKKWYRNFVVAQKLTETLQALKMKYPGMDTEKP